MKYGIYFGIHQLSVFGKRGSSLPCQHLLARSSEQPLNSIPMSMSDSDPSILTTAVFRSNLAKCAPAWKEGNSSLCRSCQCLHRIRFLLYRIQRNPFARELRFWVMKWCPRPTALREVPGSRGCNWGPRLHAWDLAPWKSHRSLYTAPSQTVCLPLSHLRRTRQGHCGFDACLAICYSS